MLDAEGYKMLMEEIKEDLRDTLCLCFERLNIAKMTTSQH